MFLTKIKLEFNNSATKIKFEFDNSEIILYRIMMDYCYITTKCI